MNNAGDLAQENDALRERLSRLSEASLRINEACGRGSRLQWALAGLRRRAASLLSEQVAESRVLVDVRAGIPLLPPFQTPPVRFPVGTLASPVRWYVLASLVAFYWPGPPTVITNSSDSILPFLAQMAPRRHSP